VSCRVSRTDRVSEEAQIAPFRRIVAVTLALSAIGAVVGAALGVLSLAGLFMAVSGGRLPSFGGPLAVAAIFGGVLGFVLAPVAAWTLMRHVPLWRAIAETSVGTVLGVAVGWLLGPSLGHGGSWPIVFGLVGFAAAALRLRLTHRGARHAGSGSDAPSG
jgi:F0F1-type ATP synthase assembly protein I